jgi:hypothetical protein
MEDAGLTPLVPDGTLTGGGVTSWRTTGVPLWCAAPQQTSRMPPAQPPTPRTVIARRLSLAEPLKGRHVASTFYHHARRLRSSPATRVGRAVANACRHSRTRTVTECSRRRAAIRSDSQPAGRLHASPPGSGCWTGGSANAPRGSCETGRYLRPAPGRRGDATLVHHRQVDRHDRTGRCRRLRARRPAPWQTADIPDMAPGVRHERTAIRLGVDRSAAASLAPPRDTGEKPGT